MAYYTHWANSWLIYILIGIPVKIVRTKPLCRTQQYIYCANHTSYLDTPVLATIANRFMVFLGKDDLAKPPLFGWMFRNLHIPVYRGKRGNWELVFKAAGEAILRGHSLGVFPEGTMNKKPPMPARFKKGAFLIAIQHQVPIVPVSIINHWKVWPKLAPYLCWCPVMVVQHAPIETKGMTEADIPLLMEKVYQVIAGGIETYAPEYFIAEKKSYPV
ncbi:lysophospholipid acyltransferase family protein [Algivirga pacifica]|uniref:Lysophospholipid acyltransferase family protein n=2 Tax=Algivirga pacifica TaxID=1162670 RepID=A0ABP9D9U3_9BACT